MYLGVHFHRKSGNPANLRNSGDGEADAHVEHVEDGPALEAADGHDDADDGEGDGRELGSDSTEKIIQ